ncbi:HAD-IIA family hydrolase [Thermomicrobium sp. 4228-Ro]|uniref:HAD-IIA family hydrolase n=1 Tax=Thermomicrobium sp. 4228-Ro TaxID=2993937 RepID=UPI0022494613|nr:HAD-IIA family hydrolase [Thermomicrobium sp. 4228-Ro]MCX2727657.1 HAD-IIA family hydrolase [Thermomicrobium sp. 4228-Ro]
MTSVVRDQLRTILRRVRGIAFDMDGVLYRGERPLPAAAALLAELAERGIGFVMVTNNATKTPEEYAAKLSRMGMTVPPERIVTSAIATRDWMRQRYRPGTTVYVLGMTALERAVYDGGYFVRAERDAQVVVNGADFALTYEKLKIATLAIRAGADWIATNADRTFPSEEGLIPGSGAIVAALQAATDRSPIVIGKPEPAMVLRAADILGIAPHELLMVGDRLDTDILAGRRAGAATALVLTGVSSLTEVQASAVRPDIVIDDLQVLLEAVRGEEA